MVGIQVLAVLAILSYVQTALANVEKVIFLGPSSLQIPQQKPTLDDLQLHVLSPAQSILRLEVRAAFPSEESSQGLASWILLEELTEGQRYEVRVCWPATVSLGLRVLISWDTNRGSSNLPPFRFPLSSFHKFLEPLS